jgi:proteic killer suppression protein
MLNIVAIKSFSYADTEAFWGGSRVARFQNFASVAIRKLQMLNAATTLNTLAAVPGNRLEPLKGNRLGQYSIRINDQWRLCFEWQQPDAYDVEITNHYT